MAIFDDLHAFVAVNGTRLQEYADKELEMEKETPDVADKYIEAESGAEFTIEVEATKQMAFKTENVEIQVHLDGKWAAGEFLIRSKVLRSNKYCLKIGGVTKEIGGNCEFRAFTFSSVTPTANEDSTWALDKRDRSDLGSIVVKAFHVTVGENRPRSPEAWEYENTDTSVAVPEKAIKGLAITHLTSLGKKQIVSGGPLASRVFVDGSQCPFAVFRFRYCSKKALQSMLLIPRTPSPTPLADRPIESLSAEEAHQLLRQYQARALEPKREIKSETNHAQEAIKHERSAKQERTVKRERDPELEELLASAAQVKKAKPTEIVDLSDD
ncbi:MAG: hypothetical protein Q9207_004832 [Kuettlingeria erythrocarpa]